MPTVSWIWLTISVLADLVSLIGVVRTKSSAPTIRRWGLPVALVTMTALATYQFLALRNLASSRYEACVLLQSWPDTWEVKHLRDGENTGIILGGLGFLERHRQEYPETYGAATALLQGALDRVPPDGESLAEAAAAMLGLVGSVAEGCEQPRLAE